MVTRSVPCSYHTRTAHHTASVRPSPLQCRDGASCCLGQSSVVAVTVLCDRAGFTGCSRKSPVKDYPLEQNSSVLLVLTLTGVS